jgi:hypothetical protein
LTIVVSRAAMIEPMITTNAIRQTWDSIPMTPARGAST